MGTYIYGICGPKHTATVKLGNGETVEVAKYAYAYKPYYHGFFEKEPRWQILAKARLFRMDRVWEGHIAKGGKWPRGGVPVFGEKKEIAIGTKVMVWPKQKGLPTSIEDCTCNGAEYLSEIVAIL